MLETDESVREALITLDLDRKATITEIRAQYLEKTSRDIFQHGVLVDDSRQKEFDKYHIAYVTLVKHLSQGDNASDLQYYPPGQVFQFHFNQGVHCFIHWDYIKAGEKFQEAYKIDKTSVPVLLYLGLLLLKRKNVYAAEKYFKEAVQFDQENEDAWFYLGESYLEAGELRKALTMFETAKKLNPGWHEVASRIKEITDRLKVKRIKTKKPSAVQRFFKKLSGQ
jgi:tetratricopeptide (TPR) repeat protein